MCNSINVYNSKINLYNIAQLYNFYNSIFTPSYRLAQCIFSVPYNIASHSTLKTICQTNYVRNISVIYNFRIRSHRNHSNTVWPHISVFFRYVAINIFNGGEWRICSFFIVNHLDLAQDESCSRLIRSKTCSIDRKSNIECVGKNLDKKIGLRTS